MTDFFTGIEVHRPAYGRQPTPAISYGLRFPEACVRHISTDLHGSRVFIIASKSLASQTDAAQRLRDALGPRVVGERIGISPHTPIAEVADVVCAVDRLSVDCLVTLGAGSITDAAKLVRFAIANSAFTPSAISKLSGPLSKERRQPSIPLVCIPTSLSGGEYQSLAGATDAATHAKKTFQPGVEVDLVILDPDLCLTTPGWVWLSTGVRAIDHCVETLCSLLSNEAADEWSRSGLSKLISGLLQSKANPSDLHVRHLCQLGVLDAMAAVASGVPLGGSHAIGHQLGPLGVGHGETSCILLPAVCKFNARKGANVARQAAMVELLLQDNTVQALLHSKRLNQSKADLGDILDVIIRELGMPRSLMDVGIGKDKLPSLAVNTLDDIWSKTNAVPLVEESQVMEILEAVLGSERAHV